MANYPLTEEDLDDNRLPAVLKPHKHKLFGLMIDAERLVAIRTQRKANSRYASFNQCQMELRAIEGIYISEGIKYLNVSEMSIERNFNSYFTNDRSKTSYWLNKLYVFKEPKDYFGSFLLDFNRIKANLLFIYMI